MAKVIFIQPVSTRQLVTNLRGQEAILPGGWVVKAPPVSYSNKAGQTFMVATLEISPIGLILLGALISSVVGYFLTRPKKGLLPILFG